MGWIWLVRALDLARGIAGLVLLPEVAGTMSLWPVGEGGRRAPRATLTCGRRPPQLPLSGNGEPQPIGASGKVRTGVGGPRSPLPPYPPPRDCTDVVPASSGSSVGPEQVGRELLQVSGAGLEPTP